ncbi:MAG TPA: GNAT family N-acetyltransferase [Methanospirillum sp.]|uniref:GNAT family N-acetyltransferase n=1 Tax=Methanospirillum sp. TaxID=45200 RepID=UPI002B995177|nr:GNAT family N-acetyltransferase [Methanospirillum sp.]HWQ63764.1 GNAT family N-acetyltransferase [Methanospirillum sp.]
MNMISLYTKRLELIPITVELCNADLASPDVLAIHLNCRIPDSWPPALLTPETLGEFIDLLTAESGSRLYAYYWVKTGDTPDDRVLIGSGGFLQDSEGAFELGYSVLEDFQQKGYATEAVNEMIKWARNKPDVVCFKACTFPSLIGSIRVLEKSGFVRDGIGSEEGSIAYRLDL